LKNRGMGKEREHGGKKSRKIVDIKMEGKSEHTLGGHTIGGVN